MPNCVMRPLIARIAITMRYSCRQLVLGSAGESASRMGKISGMGFRFSVSCLGGTYNFVPKALFSFFSRLRFWRRYCSSNDLLHLQVTIYCIKKGEVYL